MKPILFYDTETFSEANLKQVGLEKYARDPTSEVLMITWCYEQGPVHYHDLTTGPMPFDLAMMLTDPGYLKCAANHPFDRAMLKHVLGIEVPWEQCIDSHVLAYSLGFSGGLDATGEQVGLAPDKAKLKTGRKLILRFCKPQPKSHNVRRWTRENDPEGWQQFADYAIRDTESMRELWMLLHPYDSMSEQEWHYWRLTQRMNERGAPVDSMLIDQAIKMAGLRKNEIKQHMIELTGLDNPNSGTQLLPWLEQMGHPLPNLQAATLDAQLDTLPEGLVRTVIQAKRTIGQTAVTKWNSVKKMACPDDTIKGMFMFRGASRTGRDASRGINIQNLKRPPKGRMDDLIRYVYAGDNRLVWLVYGEPLDFLAGTTRGAITAPAGHKLAVSDLGSIESRVVGWLTGCSRITDLFAEGKDTYKDLATHLYHVPYEQVTKTQRTMAKPASLGCSYMLGGRGLQGYAEGMGVAMSLDEAYSHVRTFRSVYPEIPQFWDWSTGAIERAIRTGQSQTGYGLTVYLQGDFLFIRLPSGRSLAYHKPVWKMVTIGQGTDAFEVMAFTYKGLNRFKSSPTWERINAHGGLITENLVQAIARDVLMEWVDRCQDLKVVMRVHDELVVVVPDAEADQTLERMNQEIAKPIDWAPGLLLSAEGYVSKHYQKD